MARTTTTSSTRGSTAGGAKIIGADPSRADGPGPYIMDADTLIGDNVVNAAGEDLGEIKAIMLDVESGRVAYAVLSFGGFLGMGNKLFAIPWSALTLDADEKRFVLDIAKDRLDNAPGFEYYDVRPYWDDDIASRDPRTSSGSTLREPKSY